MATRATTLFSQSVVKAHLEVSVSTHDAILDRIADAVSELVEQETNTLYVQRARSEVHDGDGTSRLHLEYFPIGSTLTSLTITRSPGDTPESIAATEYTLDTKRGIVGLHTDAFTKGFQNVAVTYTPGYGSQDGSDLPAEIVGVALDILKLVWSEWTSGAMAASSINVGPGSLVIKPDWPKHIRAVLDSHRRPLVL